MENSTKIIRLVVGYSAVLGVSKLLVLATSFLLAAKLPNSDFGYISLAQAFFMAAISVFGFGAQSAYVRFTYEHGAGAVLRALAPLYFSVLAIAVFCGMLIIGYFGWQSPYSWFALLPISGLVASHLASSSAVARTTNDLRAYAIGEVARPGVLLFAMLFFFMIPRSMDVGPYYVGALLLSSLIAAAAGWGYQWRATKNHRMAISTGQVIAYVAPLLVMQLVALANGVSDRFFLAAWLSIDDVGLYGKAYLAGSTLGVVFDSLSILWGPYVVKYRKRYGVMLHPWVRSLYFGTWVVAAFFLALAWFVPKLGGSLVDRFGSDMVGVGLVVTAAFVLRIGYQVCVPVISAYDRTPTVARLAILSAMVGLASNIFFIYYWGVYGAAFATLIAFAIFSIGSYEKVRVLVLQPEVACSED